VTTPDPDPRHVSTGALPDGHRVRALVAEAHARYLPVTDGHVSQVYPALATAPADRFALALVTTTHQVHGAGDTDLHFSLMSVVKPFTFALLCEGIGVGAARRAIGSNATGLAFDALQAIERDPDGRTNPMVNPGAIATVGHLLPDATDADRWRRLSAALSRFAGRDLTVDEELLRSVVSSNHRNRGIARALHGIGALPGDPDEAVDLYSRACCLSVTVADVAAMGSVLADGGVHPLTGDRVVSLETCRAVLSVMTTAGLYETSGDWLYEVGLPGKSGIAGGIVTISPGKGALATFSPPLDAAGNSVRGRLATRFLSRSLGLDLFASEPVP
jgi:glutaminase